MKTRRVINLMPSLARGGFGLIEIMISMLLLSAIGLGFMNYLRKNQASLSNADSIADVQSAGSEIQKLISADIRQAVYLHPGCGGSPSSATTACTSIPVRGGMMPVPAGSKTTMHTATNTLGLPSNLQVATSSLTGNSDSLRLVLYDFSTPMNCKLNHYRATNPSATAGIGLGAERFWTLRSGCNGNLVVGRLYVMMEAIGTEVYSNVFQITGVTDLGGNSTSTDQLQVDVASSNSIFNQQGGLGLSGFSAAARVYPVKLVEWAHENGQGLYRREIVPTASNLNGYGSWNLLSEAVEGIQFYPVTVTTTSIIEHQRTMQFTADPNNTDVHNIRGLSVRVVIKSSKAANDQVVYDNPLTSAVEDDHIPRQEMKFYVDSENTHTN